MEAGWEVGVAPWLQRPTLLSRTWSRCRRVPRGDDRIWLPRVAASSQMGGARPALLGALGPAHWCQSCWTGHSAQRGPAPRAGRRSELGINWSRRQQERGFGNAWGGLGISRGVYECRQRCHGPFWQVMPSAKLLRVRDVCPVPKSTELYGLCPLSATERP